MRSRDHFQLPLEMLRTANIRSLTVWFAPRQTSVIGDDKTVMPPQRTTESDTVMRGHGSADPPTHLQIIFPGLASSSRTTSTGEKEKEKNDQAKERTSAVDNSRTAV